jgi:hypothetical protein
VRLRTGLVVLVAFVLATAVACSSAKQQPAAAPVQSDQHPPGHTDPAAEAPAAGAASTPEARLAGFEQRLGRHTLLVVRLTRTDVFGAPDVRRATDAAVQANTAELTALVASAYGAAEGERFGQLWRGHLDHLTGYAEAAGKGAGPAKDTARDALRADSAAYGAWLAQASKGRVAAADAERAMQHHLDELTRQTDAYAARDYAQAYRVERETYEHMFQAGASMAKGSLAPKAAARLDAAPAKLRSAFAMLLGEHMELVIDAQRATFAGTSEFQAAAAQVNENSKALVQAMGAIVGPKKAAEFEDGWAEHVEELMAYTAAVADRNQAGEEDAQEELSEYAADLAAYFRDIVADRLALGTLLGVLTLHDRHLTDHVDAYAARDFSTATRVELEGYQHIHGVADTLVSAIQRTVQPGLPVGGSQTGGGGTATARR